MRIVTKKLPNGSNMRRDYVIIISIRMNLTKTIKPVNVLANLLESYNTELTKAEGDAVARDKKELLTVSTCDAQ